MLRPISFAGLPTCSPTCSPSWTVVVHDNHDRREEQADARQQHVRPAGTESIQDEIYD